MSQGDKPIKTLYLFLGGFALTAVSFVFGAAPIHATYRQVGRPVYWLTWVGLACLLFGFGFKFLGITLFLITALVGLYNEAKSKGLGVPGSGLIAVALTSLFASISAFYWQKSSGKNLVTMTEDFFAQHVLVHLPAHTQSLSGLEISELVMQLPSIIVILFMFSLFFSLLAEGRFMTWLNKPKINRESLKNFMVPDFVIWVFIGSLLAAFMQTEIKAVNVVGLNLLNIVLVTYFFQGLAVASAYFSFLKMSSLWKIIFYVILTTQLFLLVALVGVTDFWAGFRERLAKKATGIDKSSGPNKI